MKNVREAILGVIESYAENREDIPWASRDDYGFSEGTKWIVVNA
jgi:predicted RNase H-like HicB family nuclease